MRAVLRVEVMLERQEGKFAPRDEIEDALDELVHLGLDGETIDGVGADGESVYNITEVDVTPLPKGR